MVLDELFKSIIEADEETIGEITGWKAEGGKSHGGKTKKPGGASKPKAASGGDHGGGHGH